MPPQQRARKTAAPEPDATVEEETATETPVEPQAPDAEADEQPEDTHEASPICGGCFPGGWGALTADTATVGCEHGTYTH